MLRRATCTYSFVALTFAQKDNDYGCLQKLEMPLKLNEKLS
jgi:hypothetical protein